MKNIEEIKARLAAATPGPWEFVGPDIENVPDYSSDTPTPWKQVMECEVTCGSYCLGGSVSIDIAETDAEFIAHAPTDIASLLAAVDAVTALHTEDLFRGHLSNGCKTCGGGAGWPCPTITALTTALGDGA